MNILIDTHILLWALYKKTELSETAQKLITEKDSIVYVSLASIWEIEIKHSIGKLNVFAFEVLKDSKEANFKILSIKSEHILGLEELEYIHRDPFDRLLISQAQTEGMKLLTSDSKIEKYNKDFIIMN